MLLLPVENGGKWHRKTWQVRPRGFKQFPARRSPLGTNFLCQEKREYHQPLPTNPEASSLRYKKAVISQMLNILKKSEKKSMEKVWKRGTLQPSKLFKIEQLFPLKFFSEIFFFLFGSFESFFLGFFPLSFENMNYHKKSGLGGEWESLFQFSWGFFPPSVFRHQPLQPDQGWVSKPAPSRPPSSAPTS